MSKKTTLIVARHGNTFRKGETPTRVGARTDLPLVENEKGTRIGEYLLNNNLIPDVIYTSFLARTIQTATLAAKKIGLKEINLILKDTFNEIDYGIDENKTEDEVMYRLGFEALNTKGLSSEEYIAKGKEFIDLWNSAAVPPNGWNVNVENIINSIKEFAQEVENKYKGKNILIVSSNGIIRFFPHLTKSYKECYEKYGTKLKTGGITIFEKEENSEFWTCTAWGV